MQANSNKIQAVLLDFDRFLMILLGFVGLCLVSLDIATLPGWRTENPPDPPQPPHIQKIGNETKKNGH